MRCERPGCKAYALRDDTYCFFHSDQTAERRKLASRSGGSKLKKPVIRHDIETISDVRGVLVDTLQELQGADIPDLLSKIRVIIYLCTALAKVIELERLEKRVEERLQAVEAKLGLIA